MVTFKRINIFDGFYQKQWVRERQELTEMYLDFLFLRSVDTQWYQVGTSYHLIKKITIQHALHNQINDVQDQNELNKSAIRIALGLFDYQLQGSNGICLFEMNAIQKQWLQLASPLILFIWLLILYILLGYAYRTCP